MSGSVRDANLDLLIVGSGVAGLSAAIVAATKGLSTGVVTKGALTDGTTRWAQGGVAAVMEPGDQDSIDRHLADTLAAGGGLCDVDAVTTLVSEGPERVRELMALGAVFDRDAGGNLELAIEGGHSAPRVVHAGGSATGLEIQRALDAATRRVPVALYEHHFCFDLLVANGRCVGVRTLGPDGSIVELRATNVLLAAGGAGQLFAVTTNPVQATGDGAALALRAGIGLADVEFMQFHPTALHVPAMPRPLLTEALRGHGAVLRTPEGDRFVDELQPRDMVSRAETKVMLDSGSDHVFLDVTGLADFSTRFPNIAADLAAVGLDPGRDLLPVAPAAHYLSGGVPTDLHGASELRGLWAAGEASCSGVHGANRLASNSLLEGLVFGPRVVEAICAGRDGAEASGVMRTLRTSDRAAVETADEIGGVDLSFVFDAGSSGTRCSESSLVKLREHLERTMTFDAGVLRSGQSLARAATKIAETMAQLGEPDTVARWELVNLCTVGAALVQAASARRESRGAHTRTDFPDTDPTQRHRLILRPGAPS